MADPEVGCFLCRIRRYLAALTRAERSGMIKHLAERLVEIDLPADFPRDLALFKRRAERAMLNCGFTRAQAVTAIGIMIAALHDD